MKTFWNNLVVAFSMYSKIPMPNVELTEDNMKYSLCFVPLVGAVIGGILCGWNVAWPYLCNYSFLPAVVFVIVPIIISGGIHVDGFIDTVDAICSHKPMERKLEILRDTHTGSYALFVTMSYFLIALGVWSEMPIDAVPVLAVGFVMSRALSGLATVIFPHAKTSKLLAVFTDGMNKKIVAIVMVLYIIASAALMCYLEPLYGSIGVLGAAISFAYYYYTSKKHFGGTTGDVAGYFVQVCELIIPCVVLVAWKFL
ncbi:MAG: adenosylcobinamide-GDP ribazoletransferase [Lachnospiraceae bacterium]|nr:adenosylcobinamide-GDP ribazoletransferase [Lachnospiraceae bacterium]